MLCKRFQLFLIPVLLLVWSAAPLQLGAQSIQSDTDPNTAGIAVPKHPLDESEYRRMVLENGVKVLLVSDSRFNKSAASMLVEVGSLSNPRNRQGLAHFLEHMLFLGTENYPGVDDYSAYLSQNGGYDNAYTTADHTNYYFEVNHDALEGAVDRFAQFFIAPLFTETYTEREQNAVHSEHQKNLENDTWRTYQVLKTLYRKDHPASMFSTGSNETLGFSTREELLEFYGAYYSANRMSLAILGKTSLDTLQSLAETYLSPILNHDLSRPTFEADYLPEKPTFRLIQIEPIKDVRTLEIEFPLPTFVNDFESKPEHLLGGLIGHEGKGSLLSLLKQKGLATTLSAGGYLNTQEYGRFNINVDLTPKGLEEYKEVVELCLMYVYLLKDSPYPSYYFKEMRSKAKLDEIYSDRGEGGGYATRLTRQMQRYPLKVAERIRFLYEKEDSDAYERLLSQLRPDNMIVLLTASGLETTNTEPHYGTKYSYTEEDSYYETLAKLSAHPDLILPEPNPFMPKQASIPDRHQKEQNPPVKILEEPGLVFYHSQDSEFLRPKVSLRYKIRFPKEGMNLRFKVLLDMYTASVNESLNELTYPARLAGLSYSFASGYEGVYFSINGYDESAPILFDHVLDHMLRPKISEKTFGAVQDRIVRGLKNFPKEDAYRIIRSNDYEMVQAVNYPHADRLSIAEKLTLPEILDFANTLYSRTYIEALIHGNISGGEGVRLTRKISAALNTSPVPRNSTFEQTYLVQPEPESIRLIKHLEVNNSAFRRDYFAGSSTPKNRAIIEVLNAFLSRPFFTEMRTNQQLGYIVFGGAGPLSGDPDHRFLFFIIQSGTHSADMLQERADAFIATYMEKLEALPATEFETFRTAAIEELKEKEKTIAEKANVFNTNAFDHDADFTYKQKTIEALKMLTKSDVSALLEATLAEDSRRMRTILGFARDHKPEQEQTASFDDLEAWKKKREFH